MRKAGRAGYSPTSFTSAGNEGLCQKEAGNAYTAPGLSLGLRHNWRFQKLAAILGALGLVGLAAADQYICRLAPGANPGQVGATYGLTLLDMAGPFDLYAVPNGVNDGALKAQMRQDPNVVWVEEEESVSLAETTSKGSTIGTVSDPNALYQENQGAMAQVSWSSALASQPGRAVKVAVLDTGLSPMQPSLWAQTVASANFVEASAPAWDVPQNEDSDGDGVPDEATGHGTMVAGIIFQVDPNAKFVIARVADSDGVASAWRIIKGLAFAVSQGAEVANISLGSADRIAALPDVLDWTNANGLLVCAPDGNNDQPQALFPARYHGVLAVAGVDPYDVKADFSNWDSVTRSSAPCTGILSYWWDGTMGVWSGTSFASPFVVGAVADALRKTSPMQPKLLQRLVLQSGNNIDLLNPLYTGQLGTRLNIVNLENALLQAQPAGPN